MITDIVEKWIEYSQLTWVEHLLTRTNTFGWYTIHLSIWVELCVTVPSGKGKLIPHLFSRIWSHPSFALPPVTSSRSRIFTRELKTVGVKKGGGNSTWNRKGFSSLWPLDCPNIHFTLDPYPKMLSLKQSSIKYPFLNLWYDSTRDLISRTISEHSTH